MSAIKFLAEEFADHPAFQGHPWDSKAPAHYEKEPEKVCEITGKRLPVSELLRTADRRIIAASEWELTAQLITRILDRAGEIDMELGEGLPPDSALLLEIQEALEKLIYYWKFKRRWKNSFKCIEKELPCKPFHRKSKSIRRWRPNAAASAHCKKKSNLPRPR
jgi:hypothetical protein